MKRYLITAALAAFFIFNTSPAAADTYSPPQHICVGSGGTILTTPDGINCFWYLTGPRT